MRMAVSLKSRGTTRYFASSASFGAVPPEPTSIGCE
jgi:hypothetical protein